MARRRSDNKTGLVAQLERRGAEPAGVEPAQDDRAIMAQFGISKPTLRRWRADRGFPEPDFYIGLRGFTWARRVTAWTASQPTANPRAGQSPVPSRAGAEAA